MTPLSATMSALTTLAPSTLTPPLVESGQIAALHGLHLAGLDVLGHDAAGNDVVGQDGGEFGLVGEESVQILLGHLGKRRVRRREHGERAFALERVDQTRFFQRDGEGLEVAGRNGGVDDVLGLDSSCGQGKGS